MRTVTECRPTSRVDPASKVRWGGDFSIIW